MDLHLPKICLLLTWAFMLSCSRPAGDARSDPNTMNLFPLIDESCTGVDEPCLVDLGRLVDRDWDRVVFIRMQAAPTKVAAELDMEKPDMDEFEDAVVFVDGRKIVGTAKRRYDPERPFNETVFLDFQGSKAKHQAFARKEAVFRVRRSEGKGYRNYYLYK